MADARHHDVIRVQTSLLAAAEKRLLIWMAERLSPRINSDHLTALALLAMLMAGLSYWLAGRYPAALWGASAWLGVNWFGDSLDGTLARVRGRQRPRYGYYVDHVVDAFGTSFLLGGLALSGYMSPGVAMLLLAAYFLLSIEVYLSAHVLGRFHMSYWKFGPTELRLLLCVGNSALFVNPNAVMSGQVYRLFDVGGLVAAIMMVFTTALSAVRHARVLYREEPLPIPKAQIPNPEFPAPRLTVGARADVPISTPGA
jgi:phosphatidylglycerophosphate synthase